MVRNIAEAGVSKGPDCCESQAEPLNREAHIHEPSADRATHSNEG